MTHSLLVVEGAHDASFFGVLARARGYSQVRALSGVPDFWLPMIPRRYPLEPGENLDRVIRFPEVYVGPDSNTLGVIVAGGQDRIPSSLRIPLERLGTDSFSGIGIVLDTDHDLTVQGRFNAFLAKLFELNRDAEAEGVSGFPLSLPAAPGIVGTGTPRIGIHLFPDNGRQGLLETVLLECAAAEHPLLERSTSVLVRYIDRKTPPGAKSLQRLRSASGRAKAQAGMIANIMQPGASLAVSIQTGGWLDGSAETTPGVLAADRFLASVL
jgi:hypothetical protein